MVLSPDFFTTTVSIPYNHAWQNQKLNAAFKELPQLFQLNAKQAEESIVILGHNYVPPTILKSSDFKNRYAPDIIKKVISNFKSKLPTGWRCIGEIVNNSFEVACIWNNKNIALSWENTLEVCDSMGIQTLPVLFHGLAQNFEKSHTQNYTAVVVRKSNAIPYSTIIHAMQLHFIKEPHAAVQEQAIIPA